MRVGRIAVIGFCLMASGCADGSGFGLIDRQMASLVSKLNGSAVSVQRQGDDILLEMPDVTFATGQAVIVRDYRAVLDDMAIVLSEYDTTTINVIGHTDSTGTLAINQRLSENRARAVVDYLVEQGIDRKRLIPSGEADRRPVASNDTVEGRAQNRRVELVIHP